MYLQCLKHIHIVSSIWYKYNFIVGDWWDIWQNCKYVCQEDSPAHSLGEQNLTNTKGELMITVYTGV